MITAGMTFSRSDGSIATVQPNKFTGWNLELDTDNVITGLTGEQVEQEMAAYRMAQARAAETQRIADRKLAAEISQAWDAALLFDAKFNAKRIRKNLVPGTDQHRYATCGDDKVSAELLLFLEAHYSAITAGVKSLVQFRANYVDAGHEYVEGTPGVRQCGESAWFDTFTIRLDGTPIPDALLLEIASLQVRCGIREGQQSRVGHTKGIYCNCLAWELIRRGAKVGPRG